MRFRLFPLLWLLSALVETGLPKEISYSDEWDVPQSVQALFENGFPEGLTLHLPLPSAGITRIHLKRVHAQHDEIVTYISTGNSQGSTIQHYRSDSKNKMVSTYHGTDSAAIFLVTICTQKTIQMEGHFDHEGSSCSLRPKPNSHITGQRSKESTHLVTKEDHLTYKGDYVLPPQGDEIYNNIGRHRAREATKGDGISKRSITDDDKHNYEVDVLAFVDFRVYRRFYDKHDDVEEEAERRTQAIEEVQYYMVHLVENINIRFRTIDHPEWTLGVKLVGLHVNTEESMSSMDRTELNSTDALSRFKEYLDVNEEYFGHFDHALVLTSINLLHYSNDSQPVGIAGITYLTGICEPQKISVIRFHGGLTEGITGAHELAHNLGANHDGSGNQCSGDDQYIMAANSLPATDETYGNYYKFSNCSVDSIAETIALLEVTGNNCLRELSPHSSLRGNHLGDPPGLRYSPDEMCKELHGESWAYIRGSDGANICQRLRCVEPGRNLFRTVAARGAEGTTCGNHKWCQMGECTRNQTAPQAYSDECPYGDIVGTISSSLTCENISAWHCYNLLVERECCESCADYRAADLLDPDDDACRYGDHQKFCQNIMAFNCYFHSNNATCCDKCKQYERDHLSPSMCRYGDWNPNCDEARKDVICADSRNHQLCCELCSD